MCRIIIFRKRHIKGLSLPHHFVFLVTLTQRKVQCVGLFSCPPEILSELATLNPRAKIEHNFELKVALMSLTLRLIINRCDRLCGLVVRVLGYRSGGLGSIPGTTKKKVVGLERGPLSFVSTTEELLDRNVATPV
jgi:hypothetical protein